MVAQRNSGVTSRTKAPPKGTPAYQWWLEERRASNRSLEDLFALHVARILLPAWGAPRLQYTFLAHRRFRLDAAYIPQRLAIEIDGDLWAPHSGHTSGAGAFRDREKGNELACYGWRLIRLTRAMLEDGSALTYVERALKHG
ncbi:MAG: hypothetical protein ACHQ4H_18310 [Ktedonobacterales bacterium]